MHDPETFDWNDCYTGTLADHEPPNARVLATASELTPGRALDVGCGAGGLLVELGKRGWQVAGLDLSAKAIEAARRVTAKHGVEAELTVAHAAKHRPEGTYDLVTNCFALPGTKAEQAAALGMMRDALAPGGTLVLIEFDEGMKRHAGVFGSFHHPSVEEVREALEGLEIITGEVVDTPAHSHGGGTISKEAWTALFVVARAAS